VTRETETWELSGGANLSSGKIKSTLFTKVGEQKAMRKKETKVIISPAGPRLEWQSALLKIFLDWAGFGNR